MEPAPEQQSAAAPAEAPERGFTLLEVMIALAILAISFTALLGTQSSAVVLTRYINGITVASMLARSKWFDLEHELKKDGFDAFGEDHESGDFGDEGHRDFRWDALIEKIELDEGAVERMLEGAPQTREEVVGKLADNPQLQGVDLSGLNFNPGMIYGFIPTAIEILGERVRKCTLTVMWKDGRRERSLMVQGYFVQHEEFTKAEGRGDEDEEEGQTGGGTKPPASSSSSSSGGSSSK